MPKASREYFLAFCYYFQSGFRHNEIHIIIHHHIIPHALQKYLYFERLRRFQSLKDGKLKLLIADLGAADSVTSRFLLLSLTIEH